MLQAYNVTPTAVCVTKHVYRIHRLAPGRITLTDRLWGTLPTDLVEQFHWVDRPDGTHTAKARVVVVECTHETTMVGAIQLHAIHTGLWYGGTVSFSNIRLDKPGTREQPGYMQVIETSQEAYAR